MNNIFKKISVFIIFTLMLQVVVPLTGLANTNNELDLIRQETNLTDKDIQLSLEIISDNSSVFLESADTSVLDSYGLEDQNIALLKYFYDTSYITQSPDSSVALQTLSTEEVIQPRLASILIRTYIKKALKDKMGDRIEKQIGDKVKNEVEDKWVAAAEKEINKHGYSKLVGPQGTGANGIKQGEHVFSIYGQNGTEIMRAHVGRELNGAATNWHYHLKYDNFIYHHEQLILRHNTLPAWGSPAK